MKYTDKNPPIRCIMTGSTCYKGTRIYTPKGVLWHSTGANNVNLKRYVQPPKNDPNYSKLMTLLGKNTNGNSWNDIYREAGVSAWVGKLADGTIATVQALEWNQRNWGCGSGRKGSLNNTHIQFEILESSPNDKNYYLAVYKEACELTAYLCKKYGFDPYGTFKYQGVTVPVITCHQDSYKMGLGSNHGDIYTILPPIGKNMETVRDDVNKLMKGGSIDPKPTVTTPPVQTKPKEEEEEMTYDAFKTFMNQYLEEQNAKDGSSWSKVERDWAVSSGLVKGDQAGKYMWQSDLTREAAIVLFKRFSEMTK